MIVGVQLRRLREEQGLSRADAGYLIRASESKISRMELGQVSFKERDVVDLLDFYRADQTERETLLSRVREANAHGWWQPYADVMPNWFHRYVGLEATAELIRTYELQFIPGLLQTEAYARAVVRLNQGIQRVDDIDRRVALRVERRHRVLGRPDPPRLWAVVDEAALRRPVGGLDVMRDQLEALIAVVTKATSVRLQVLPLDVGGHAATGGPFTILRFPHQELPDLVYLEQLTSALYLDSRDDVDVYFDAANRLVVEAAPPERTIDILARIIHDLNPHDGR